MLPFSSIITVTALTIFPCNHIPQSFAFSLLPSSSSTTRPRNKISLQMSSSDSTNNLSQAKRQIAQAISIGAPAYNSGDITKCADVYEDTARDISELLPTTLRTKLEQTLDDIAAKNTPEDKDDNANAWALRKQFDAIVDYAPPSTPISSSELEAAKISLEPFTAQQLPPQPIGVMDGVMGGVSSGSWIPDTRTFVGTTSLQNNGGFASIRWRFGNVQNWSYAKGIYFKVRHSKPEEHTFRLILKDATCERIRLTNFKAVFANPDNSDDATILIPFSDIGGMEQMGNAMVGAPAFNPSVVTEIGIMAIKPTVVGDFEITIDDWGLYT